ncbi:MAG: hypothetical protein RR185_02040 [Angelakisella sp.]
MEQRENIGMGCGESFSECRQRRCESECEGNGQRNRCSCGRCCCCRPATRWVFGWSICRQRGMRCNCNCFRPCGNGGSYGCNQNCCN